jgi:hypothetical protein
MTFDDLPDSWSQLPLTTQPLLDDVLDLMVGVHDRIEGGLVLLVCDSEVRLVQPIVIGPGHVSFDPALAHSILSTLGEAFAHISGGALVVAVARRSGLDPTPDDEAWVATLRDGLRAMGWTLSSAHVVTMAGARPIAA